MPLESLSHALLDAARQAGAEAADALCVSGTSLSIDVREGALEEASRSESTDIGLRVFVNGASACVSASDTSAQTITALAQRAVAMAREAPADPYAGLADPDQLTQTMAAEALALRDPSPEPGPEALLSRALAAEAAARDVAGVTQVSAAGAGYGETAIWLAATNGFSAGYTRTTHSTSCVAIAGTGAGMERDYDGDARIFAADLRDPRDIGARAGARAVERIGARKPKTGRFAVLFDERVAGSLIGHLLAATNGTAIARGASWLIDARGAQILPKGIDLIEDARAPRKTGSRPFDGEGLPTGTRAIVEDGVLQDWTMDLASARKLGLRPTGNAARGTSAPPSPANWNISMTQGAASRADLIAQMGEGLLVTSMIGSTINPNTGDYSRGAAGFWVENGRIAYPVNECTIAGNLRDMLAQLIPANDAQLHLSRAIPSILIESMTIAGN